MSARHDPKGRGCWYFTYTEACVLCGITHSTRERRWTRKPRNPQKRFEYVETACGVHFV